MGAQLRSEGFDGAAIVMPGGARVRLPWKFRWPGFVMADGLGVWVGELLHNQCDLRDLFDYAGSIRPATAWVPLTRKLAIWPPISRPGQSGPSDGWIFGRCAALGWSS